MSDSTSRVLHGRWSRGRVRGATAVIALLTGVALLLHPAAGASAAEGDGGEGHRPGVSIGRIDGTDRFAVAARLAESYFTGAPLDYVYVASGEVFSDALSGSAAAGVRGAPVLLVRRDEVPPETAAVLSMLKPEHIVILGGTATISAAVEGRLAASSTDVARIGGADRYAVSAAISADAFTGLLAPEVYIASGATYPDALSGTPAAGRDGAPMLLVERDAIPPAVRTELVRLAPSQIHILGGLNSVSEAVASELNTIAPVDRVSGSDRFEVSAEIATTFSGGPQSSVVIASGLGFADALAGGAAAFKVSTVGLDPAPVLLVTANAIPAPIALQLARIRPARITVLGGVNSISPEIYEELKYYLRP